MAKLQMNVTEQAWTAREREIVDAAGRTVAVFHVLYGTPNAAKDYVKRAVACVNALAGIEDPAALRAPLNDLRKWLMGDVTAAASSRPRLNALDAILDDLYDMIPEPTEADND